MSIDDDILAEEDDELEDYKLSDAAMLGSSVDPRRMIERRLELKRLREQLDDPAFYYDFD